MSDIVISAENLGKKYTIGHQGERGRYLALRDVVVQNARAFWNKTGDLLRGRPIIQGDTLEEVWALKDVSFEVKRGEALGIIGRNGAGKSTLLKILSRITEPTTGRVTIKGRVSSLLEVGTGFHPELTGRENIFLNGTILGMTRAEIKRKFDEIVAFAEIEKFLDTPVKRYSSGMYVRLAFAVAAHLEPEILIVDEVLAVGDAQFQKKCLGKMSDVASEGRTVLFVSHNMGAVSELCTRAMQLNSGTVANEGAPNEVIGAYLRGASHLGRAVFDRQESGDRARDDIRVAYVETKRADGTLCSVFQHGEQIVVEIGLECGSLGQQVVLGVGFRDSLSRQVLHFNSRDSQFQLILTDALTRVQLAFVNVLNKDDYYVTLWVGDERLTMLEYITDCLRFSTETTNIGNTLARGQVILPGEWSQPP
ncbi:MAG TPA: ABC transporter ATP-binding protein [Candidatus Latescibacteria bacterium]|nr:ABC transporter ATP-binding protein [Candidatus Latescibacterota bacterium]HOS64373.1 ABC transporter ATP-binding protein [Candidatus Latescibacterota bacterium]HPK75274.1 ABC transporter ATP-binding protein [Candidatus Latescibacterota bacterium]